MPLKILNLSTYAGGGGAARAASNVNTALQRAGVDSRMLTAHGNRFKLTRAADRALWKLQRSPVDTWRSPARFGSLSAKSVNESPADIVNLHWVTDGFLSIEEIGKIKKPVVMSMYDMWSFCGTEHYGVDSPAARWRTGYTKFNRSVNEVGFDIDRYTWERKLQNWDNFHLIPPSAWLEAAARESALCSGWPITRVPHIVDDSMFQPLNRDAAKHKVGASSGAATIGFVASAGITDVRKGFDLLREAFRQVQGNFKSVQLLIVGPEPERHHFTADTPARFTGPISNDADLAIAYNAMDVVVVPSREDNMPLTAMEAHMCGRPVVGFKVGGLSDIVVPGSTGVLTQPYSTSDLADGILLAIEDSLGPNKWGISAREHALASWSRDAVVQRLKEVFSRLAR